MAIGKLPGEERIFARLTAPGWTPRPVVKRGRQLCYVDVEVKDADGRLCAKGRVLYALRSNAAP